MADPLSIAASVITVIGAADSIGKTLGKIRTAKNAPAAVLALQNEVSDLRVVLGDVDVCSSDECRVEPTSTTARCLKRLALLITSAENHLRELDRILYHRLIRVDPLTASSHISRMGWLRTRNAVEDIRSSLRATRQDIALQLASINL